jgi:hypothetical protein
MATRREKTQVWTVVTREAWEGRVQSYVMATAAEMAAMQARSRAGLLTVTILSARLTPQEAK